MAITPKTKWTEKKVTRRKTTKKTVTKKNADEEKLKSISDEEKKKIADSLIKKNTAINKKTSTKEVKKNTAWRKFVMTDAVLQQLKLYFAVWFSDEKACYYAKISTSSFYAYQKEHPELLEEKMILKESITDQAKIVVWKSVKQWNVADAKWRLERKDPGNFSTRTNLVNATETAALERSEEDNEMYNRILLSNFSQWNEI